MLADSHAHISKKDYDIKEISASMELIINSGADSNSNKEVLEISENYKNIFCTLGIHPDEITENIDNDLNFIEENITKCVGVGEIGLDYYHDTNKELQQEVLRRQIRLALKYKKPLVIHSRDAYLDTYNILEEENAYQVNVVIHCFSYSYECALAFVKKGAKLGIGGVLTFNNAKNIVEIAQNIDLSNFLLETDSPYLAPVPFRGMKNEPKNVLLVAKKLAEIKGISLEEVINANYKNITSFFDIKQV
jgi:TatD DNase family protein